MEYERKGITITWQIENVQDIFQTLTVSSPAIPLNVLGGTRLILAVKDTGTHPRRHYFTVDKEVGDNTPKSLLLSLQFSVKTPTKAFSTEYRVLHYEAGRTNHWAGGNKLKVYSPLLESLIDKSKHYPDTIIIRCKIWKHHASVSRSGHFFVRTRMKTESCVFVGQVRDFRDLPLNVRVPLRKVKSSEREELMQVNFVLLPHPVDFTSLCYIEFALLGNQTRLCFNFKLKRLDSSGNRKFVETYLHPEFVLTSNKLLELQGFSRESLLLDAAESLTRGNLILHGEIVFLQGIKFERVEETDAEAAEVRPATISIDLDRLISKKGNSDMSLRTDTETFPVHTAVLSAKSETFEAMFRNDMRETLEKCVHIEEVDAETVKRMLVFLYTDTLEEMGWKDARKLYLVADKYLIASLKSRCIEFLKQELDLSNCIVLLRLAVMHSDEELKKAVQDYIILNKYHISSCYEWKDFRKRHPDYFDKNS